MVSAVAGSLAVSASDSMDRANRICAMLRPTTPLSVRASHSLKLSIPLSRRIAMGSDYFRVFNMATGIL